MTRPQRAASPLPRAAGPTAAILSCGGVSTIAAGGLALLDVVPAAAAAGVLGAGSIAGVVALNHRTRRRRELLDLFLLALSPSLGWKDPDRDHVIASGWQGWADAPKRLRVRYNPLDDDVAIEISGEARKQAERRFKKPYRLAKHDERRAVLTLQLADESVDMSADIQRDRVKTLVQKTFGADAKTAVKLDKESQPVEFTVKYEVSPRLASSAARARIESVYSAHLPGRWRAHWQLTGDQVRFEVRPSLAGLILNPTIAPEKVDPLATYDDLRVPIGVDEDGNVISWRPKHDPHGLITGKTGKGKTVVLLGIIMFLAAQGWRVWGIDGKRIELLGLREYPNVELLAGRIDHQARVAHKVFEIMSERFEKYEAGEMKLEDFEPVLFVIDEYKTFRNAVTHWYRTVKPKGGLSQPPTLQEISDFVSLARKARMHLVLGLQRPDAEFLTGDMRDNFNFRVSLGRLSPDAAKMMWDSFSTGVAIPVNSRGRGIAFNEQGDPVELQTYWTPDPYQTDPADPKIWVTPDDLDIIQRLHPKETLWETKAIVDPEEMPDLDGNGEGELNYNDYMAARIGVASLIASSPVRKAAGVIIPAPSAVERAQAEADRDDAAEDAAEDAQGPFAGYSDPSSARVSALLDDGDELLHDGALILVDENEGTWALVDSIEPDELDLENLAISYTDFETGEQGAISLAADEVLQMRLPASSS